MMRGIAEEKRREAVRLYLLGLPYEEIARRLGISAGSVVNIIREAESGSLVLPGIPSDRIPYLRRIASGLRRKGAEMPQALRDSLRRKFEELGIRAEILDEWLKLFEKLGEEKGCSAGRGEIEALAEEKERLEGEIEELRRRLSACKAELSGKEEALRRLSELGFGEEELLRLHSFLSRTSRKEGIEGEKLKDKFFSYLSTFAELTELERRREEEARKVRELERRREILEGENEELEARRKALEREISEIVREAARKLEELLAVLLRAGELMADVAALPASRRSEEEGPSAPPGSDDQTCRNPKRMSKRDGEKA